MGFLSRRHRGKGPQLAFVENLLVFLELWQETWGSSQIMTGTSGTRSCCLSKVQSPYELRGASWDSSPVAAGLEVLMWS